MNIRKSVVAGSFYPNDKNELLTMFENFNLKIKKGKTFSNIRALIVPHAGYIYSGYTANLAYKSCEGKNPKKVIVIGPSHNTYLEGASVALYNEYETPLGNISIDLEFSKDLISKYDFLDFNVECEFEHSTETQAPFIKYYFPDTSIVEIVYGKCNYKDISKLIIDLLQDKDVLIVISTDLSHFHNEEKANNLDNQCIEAIKNKDINLLDMGEACGKIGVASILDVAKAKNMNTEVLHYCTSANITKDKSRVVGYTSALIGE